MPITSPPGVATRPAPDAPTFALKRAFLASGAPWPEDPPPECVDTHASIVFLTRDRAWKLKKPVHLMHVDQRTFETRAQLCREEIRLNRELAGDIYRGLTPIVQRPGGGLALGGAGRVVDYLIEIVRLPAEKMLDQRIVHGPPPGHSEIDAAMDVLIGFYRSRPPVDDAGPLFYNRLLSDCDVARDHLREMGPAHGVRLPGDILDLAAPAMRRCRSEILKRARAGRIIDCHGDLRAEHICMLEPPVAFDRLEIDSVKRIVDPFFEINALGLECGLLGAEWIGPRLLARLAQAFAPPSPQLQTAYGMVACLTRARLAIDHFRDSVVAKPEKWRTRTQINLDLAARLMGAAEGP